MPILTCRKLRQKQARRGLKVDKARSVLYLRARVVLASISLGAYALYLLSTKL